MAKKKFNIPPIHQIPLMLKEDRILPIYFIFGEDYFAIQKAVKLISEKVSPLVESDFDKETLTLEKKANIQSVIGIAATFPFGGGKRLITVKNFENISKPDELKSYVNNPEEATVLIITRNGTIKNDSFAKEPYKSLLQKGFAFIAEEPKGGALRTWVKSYAAESNLKVNDDNAQLLIDFVGNDRSLLKMQIDKFSDFLKGEGEITAEVIEELASSTKEYDVFSLLKAVGLGDKTKSLEIIYNLLDKGTDLIPIVSLLTKYITLVAQSFEIKKERINEFEASRKMGVSPYFYRNAASSTFFTNNARVVNAGRALLDADIAIKTTAASPKDIATKLIASMLA